MAQFAHKMKFKHRSSVYRMIKFGRLPEGVTAKVYLTRMIIVVDENKIKWPRVLKK